MIADSSFPLAYDLILCLHCKTKNLDLCFAFWVIKEENSMILYFLHYFLELPSSAQPTQMGSGVTHVRARIFTYPILYSLQQWLL